MSERQKKIILITGFLVVAFALRIFRIDSQSLWWDEGISLHLATSGWRDIALDRLNNIHPPGYFFLLKVWVNLTGITPFATRYLSALASLLQVTAVYTITKRFFNLKSNRVAYLAAFFVMISPLSIIYGQEVRVYALLPLIFLGLIGTLNHLIQAENQPLWSGWLSFGITAWLGLHLHYIAAFMVLYCGLWGVLAFYRQKEWQKMRRLFLTGGAVFLFSWPWFLLVVQNFIAVQSEANAGTFLTEPVPFDFLLKQIGVFHLTGLGGALRFQAVVWSATAVFTITTLLLLILLIKQVANLSPAKEPKHSLLTWLSLWLIPLFSALYVWSVRSFSHPRYISMFAMGLFPLLAYLAAITHTQFQHRDSEKNKLLPAIRIFAIPLQFGLFSAVITISTIGLYHYFINPNVQKDDVRAVARYLETAASPQDLIIIPDTDYSLQFEYQGETPIVMLGVDERDNLIERARSLTSQTEKIFVIDYEDGTRDWQEIIPFLLNNGGVHLSQTPIDNLLVDEYIMDTLLAPIEGSLLNVPLTGEGRLTLRQAYVEQAGNDTGAVAVALQWSHESLISSRLRGTLRLVDDNGRILNQATIQLIDQYGRPTDQWASDQPFWTYHVLSIPEGTPPLNYTVTLDIFTQNDAGSLEFLNFLTGIPQQDLPIGQTMLVKTENRSEVQESVISHLPTPIQLNSDLALIGFTIDRQELLSGQTLFVTLLWEALNAPSADYVPEIRLMQGDDVLTAVSTSTTLERYPTSNWHKNERILEQRPILIPADSVGETAAQIYLAGNTIPLDMVNIIKTDRIFTPPNASIPLDETFGQTAKLIGVDLPQQAIVAEQGVPITLYWEAITNDETVPYKIFVHLLDENNNIVGQVDVEPVGGERPFASWLQGEFITDPLTIPLKDQTYQGIIQITIGIYDPINNTRLLTKDGIDALILPLELEVK